MDKPASFTTPSDSVITILDVPEKTTLDTPSSPLQSLPPSSKSNIEAPGATPGPGQSLPPQMGGDNGVVTPPFKELIVVLIGLIYGRFSDIFGRKTTYLFAIVVFLIGSALCGASQNMTMLIISRGLSGIGAGGIMSTAMIIVAGLVSLRDRGKYQGLFGGVFAVSSVIGPLLGGVFSDHATWRWAFFINLPIGIITLAVIVKLLHLPHVKGSFKEKVKRIDALGAITLVIGLTLVLLALNWGGSTHPWNSSLIIGLFCGGFAVLLVFCMIEWKQAAEPIIPFRLFKNRTNVAVFTSSFFLGTGFLGIMFFMPLYFQIVRQESATIAGLEMLPLVAGMMTTSISSGNMISKWGQYRPFIWVGFVLATTGIGLLTLLQVDSNRGSQIGFMLII
ncbi:hypothetical protein BG015_006809, partial [Linnemannia schmuckeri]